jgi:acyl-CoA synthetase (AMP-forming)/AMP-acid ligase II
VKADEPQTLDAVLGGASGDVALIAPEEGRELRYGELVERVARTAGLLRAAGARHGDRVALVLDDGPAFVIALLAVARLGAAAAPLNPAYTRREHEFFLADLRPSLLVVPAAGGAAAREALAPGARVVELELHDGLPVDGHARPADSEGRPDDPALLLHTSGTTSRPKQVPLLHRNLVASARSIAAHYRLAADDVSYCAMPLFHVHGLLASTLAALAAGGAAVLPRRLSPGRVADQLDRFGATWLSAGPTTHRKILDRAGRRDGGGDTRLRFLRSCSSALGPALLDQVEAHFDVPLLEAYGMTEASHQIASNPLPPGRRVPGSVGVAAGAEVAVLTSAGTIAGAGPPGEIVVRGPGVMVGYLGNPEANADAFVDGWFRTGDWGVLDDDGYVRLEGRLKEIIIRGGENISPLEVEEALLAHPAVADAVCFGLADPRYGETVAAAVALRSEATPQELRDFCSERLAAFKVPRTIEVVDEIPRTPTGKLQRRRVAGLLGIG